MSDSLVHIATYHDAFEAQVARSRLAGEGIASHLDGEVTSLQDWLLTNAIGGLKLFVRDDQAEAAARVLERAQHPPASVESDDRHDEKDDDRDDEFEDDADEGPELEEDDDDVPGGPREDMAERAFRATWLAFFLPPLFLYSTYLLFRVLVSDDPLSPLGQLKSAIAGMINVAVWTVVAFWLRS